MIECRDVSAHVGTFELHNVSFVVPDGEHAILTGPTASGKTTLLETIAGAVIPKHGEIILAGTDVTHLQPELRQVGLVHQHGYLFPHLTVRENVGYATTDAALVDLLMRRFEIIRLGERLVHSLSGGERQIVALCRALAAKHRIVLLDEPFSALDTARRRHVTAEFAAIQKDWTLTVLHVTHHGDEALSLASIQLEINEGVLREVALNAT